MDLRFRRRIASALLPFEYREHVLGDLEERGFHINDIVSILPRVWMSHILRDPTLWFAAIWPAVMGIHFAAVVNLPYRAAAGVVLVFTIVGLVVRRGLASKDRRKQLTHERVLAQPGFQIIFFPLLTRIASYVWPSGTKSQQFILAIVCTLLFVFFGRLRTRYVERELQKLSEGNEPTTIFGNSMI